MPYLQVYMTIDTKILISQRTVTDIVTFFGDIGGLAGFLLACIGLLIGPFPAKLFSMSKAKKFFLVQLQKKVEQR